MLTRKQPAYQLTKPNLTVIRPEAVLVEVKKSRPRILSRKICLMPPVNEFNTGYLKEKLHDPL